MKNFVVAGTGRSGTMGTCITLNRAGVRTSFEQFFCAREATPRITAEYLPFLESAGLAGEVSSLAPPYLCHLTEEVVVIHQVRNPIATIASLMGQWSVDGDRTRWWPNIKFNRSYLPATSLDDTPLAFCAKYWLDWNAMVEPHACLRYRVEDFADGMRKLYAAIEAEWDERAVAAVAVASPTCNTGSRDKRITWNSFPLGDIKERVYLKAVEYGYTSGDLESYRHDNEDALRA